MSIRVGIGYDVHQLVAGRKLILGGVDIPFEKGLHGWSDGDAPIHAIIDALLGATALGDIGTYFPSDNPDFKDISSLVLLRETSRLLEGQGWRIGNVDVTIIAQDPRLAPHIREMTERIAESLAIGPDQVGVKAKTADGLGIIGHGEGIAACAVALVRRSDEDT